VEDWFFVLVQEVYVAVAFAGRDTLFVYGELDMGSDVWDDFEAVLEPDCEVEFGRCLGEELQVIDGVLFSESESVAVSSTGETNAPCRLFCSIRVCEKVRKWGTSMDGEHNYQCCRDQ
jgi:hypothetical protein